jgi:hypothetical protein
MEASNALFARMNSRLPAFSSSMHFASALILSAALTSGQSGAST